MTPAFASGAAVEIFDQIDSTNAEAKRRAAARAVGPLWLIALRQTSGYGRRGSEWRHRGGDIAATLLFRPAVRAEIVPQLSFVAGLAVADAILRFAPQVPLTLKWPNDILVGGAKVAGILLELIAGPPPLIAFGAGVNVVTAPKGLDYPTARVIDLMKDAPPSPRDFVRALDETFLFWRGRWEREGFAPIRAEWLQRADNLGGRIRVRLADEVIDGEFEDLDSDGALIVQCAGARRRIAAGAILPPQG